MKRPAKLLLVLASIVGLPCISYGQAPGQRFFSDCGIATVQHPVSLTPDVLKVLLATPQASGDFGYAKDSEDPRKTNPASLFQASAVDLSGRKEADLVVVGYPPLDGADNCWYWVVRSVRANPKVVLFSTGSSLEEMTSRTKGFRDFRSVWSSAAETVTEIYHFDGTEYVVWKKHVQERSVK